LRGIQAGTTDELCSLCDECAVGGAEFVADDRYRDIDYLTESRQGRKVLRRRRQSDVDELLGRALREPRLKAGIGVGLEREIAERLGVSLEPIERRRVLLAQGFDRLLEPDEKGLLDPACPCSTR
jgi:hypothetical protein